MILPKSSILGSMKQGSAVSAQRLGPHPVKHLLGRAGRIIRRSDRAGDGDARDAGCQHLGEVLAGDAADGEGGMRIPPATARKMIARSRALALYQSRLMPYASKLRSRLTSPICSTVA